MNKETEQSDVAPDELIDIEEYGKNGKTPPKGRHYRIRLDKKQYVIEKEVVTGREILDKAGKTPERFRLDQKLRGGATKKIEADDEVDLTTPGIERFMTLPLDSQEGSAAAEPSLVRDFDMPEEDVEHLEARGLPWETVAEGRSRWLLIHDFPVPEGYTVATVTLALMIPAAYPSTQIDMFFVHPFLVLADGRAIAQTQARATVRGVSFQRWSRHRTSANPWRPDIDNVATHLGVVEECLVREVRRG